MVTPPSYPAGGSVPRIAALTWAWPSAERKGLAATACPPAVHRRRHPTHSDPVQPATPNLRLSRARLRAAYRQTLDSAGPARRTGRRSGGMGTPPSSRYTAGAGEGTMASAGRRWRRPRRIDSIGGTERAMPAWARRVRVPRLARPDGRRKQDHAPSAHRAARRRTTSTSGGAALTRAAGRQPCTLSGARRLDGLRSRQRLLPG